PSGRGDMTGSTAPRGTDVLVIGAGAIGAAISWYCTLLGLSVRVVDRGAPGGGTSSRCEGNILVSDKERGPELDLARYSLGLWYARPAGAGGRGARGARAGGTRAPRQRAARGGPGSRVAGEELAARAGELPAPGAGGPARARHRGAGARRGGAGLARAVRLPRGRRRGPLSRRLAGDADAGGRAPARPGRSEEHTSELQSRFDLVCRLLLEKKTD